MDALGKQLADSEIPFPARALLERELRGDGQGVLPESALRELEEIHATRLHLFLKRQGSLRRMLETVLAYVPLLATVLYIKEERAMVQFVTEGGIGMYGILALGVLLLGRELLTALRVVVVRDHAAKNLRLDTPSVLVGCLALLLVSAGSTILGLHASVARATTAQLSYEALFVGAKESLASIALGSLLGALVLLAHYATRRTLAVWRAA